MATATTIETLPAEDPKVRRSRLAGAGILAMMGVLHFAVPTPFDRIVPTWMPGDARSWTYLSGVWELSSAALLANRGTKKLGGYVAALTFLAVYPANIQAAIDEPPVTPLGVAMLVRLPLQIPMILWALRHSRRPA